MPACPTKPQINDKLTIEPDERATDFGHKPFACAASMSPMNTVAPSAAGTHDGRRIWAPRRIGLSQRCGRPHCEMYAEIRLSLHGNERMTAFTMSTSDVEGTRCQRTQSFHHRLTRGETRSGGFLNSWQIWGPDHFAASASVTTHP